MNNNLMRTLKKYTNRLLSTKNIKLLGSLLIIGLSFLSFSNAGTYTITGSVNNLNIGNGGNIVALPIPLTTTTFNGSMCPSIELTCTFNNVVSAGYIRYKYFYRSATLTDYDESFGNYIYPTNGLTANGIISSFRCTNYYYISIYAEGGATFKFDYSCTLSGDYISSQGGSCPTCPEQYTSEQCQSEYDLVPNSDLTNCQNSLNSCQENTSGFNNLLNSCSNNLNACNNSLTNCLQQNCPENFTGINWSSIFINNIQYPGAPTIKFTIPQEIERDNYTNEEEMNIDVIGYGYDQEKMQNMVNTQYYKPTAEEMSKLIEKTADFMPLVAVALLILRARRIIKKIF